MRTCLITGANGGIGQALVNRFNESGYRVIATDKEVEGNEAEGVAYIQSDLSRVAESESYANNFFAEIARFLANGRLDVLVNNAALQIIAPAAALTRSNWARSLQVNVLAPFILIQGMADFLTTARGCVINISSIHTSLTKPGFAAYSTSKSALSGVTRAMSIEYGKQFRVNEVVPAAIETEMLKAGFSDSPAKYKQLKNLHPVGSIGLPEELANLVLAIADPTMSFLNGASIEFDGGISNCLLDPGALDVKI